MVARKPGPPEFHLAYLDCLGHNLRFEVLLATLQVHDFTRKFKQLVAGRYTSESIDCSGPLTLTSGPQWSPPRTTMLWVAMLNFELICSETVSD